MLIDPAGWPFVLGAVLAATLLGWWGGWWVAGPCLALALLFLFFFRDPDRTAIGTAHNTVLSPADGRVMVAGSPQGRTAPPGDWQQISIFLSPMDVHVNRIPVSGRVTGVDYHPGRFLPAYQADSGDLNERTELRVDHDGQTIVFRQIVGILARRVVCRAHEGDMVTAGQRFGVMKFGSRMDVFVPASATLLVTPNMRVVAGLTAIATLGAGGGTVEARPPAREVQ